MTPTSPEILEMMKRYVSNESVIVHVKVRQREPSIEMQQMLDNINAYEETPHNRLVRRIHEICRKNHQRLKYTYRIAVR